MRTGARSIALGALSALAVVVSAWSAGAWPRRATAPEHQSLDDVIGLPGGAILAAGTESSGINRALLIELEASGALAWAREHGNPAGTAGERAHAVTVLPDGDLVVAGRSVVLAQGAWRPFGWVARLSPDAVDVRWSTRLSEPAGQGVFHDLVATADGGVVAAGQASEGGSVLPWLVKLAPGGAPQWEARFEPATGALAFGMAALADGGLVACGPGLSAFAPSWIARLAADGTLLWQREIAVVLRALAPDPAAPDGTVVAAGWTRDSQAWAGSRPARTTTTSWSGASARTAGPASPARASAHRPSTPRLTRKRPRRRRRASRSPHRLPCRWTCRSPRRRSSSKTTAAASPAPPRSSRRPVRPCRCK